MTPTLTLTAAPDAARAPELFVVATHKVRDRAAGAPNQWVPYGVEHAWQPGTRHTLCGEFMTGWTVFWERQFSARPTTACPACIEMTLPEASRRRLDRLDRPAATAASPAGHPMARAS